ncbi:hypothetical protein TTHERM_00268290 (macronuclear) [Tetrahymena thermophila SB210]|uniref:Uncharacterized protein n=1 Tax=Tetrahymena thermophila (strain SB210) TaxID=312017 RepID=I7MJ13_TETTS|nr:hypothetical protein TTHERM_00268290 [Tetrahymena thermophila SB210]EAR95718.2 hypothetical protein TTHERM_00268290 [Tetrahymena thermophila SB210]|eukprot:XP_001015963.2 hypothetical protein TTHERM_00268290 [Tetrahymena thermophila SB210]
MDIFRNNYQFFVNYSPQIHEIIPLENNTTDYQTFLNYIDIDFNQNLPPLPEDHSVKISKQYQIQNCSSFIFNETLSFTAQRQNSLYNLEDFKVNENNNNNKIIEQNSFDKEKLMTFLSNKYKVEGNTNTIFIILSKEYQEVDGEIQLNEFISQQNQQYFLYGFMNEQRFYQQINQVNQVISKAYFKVKESLVSQQRDVCLQLYMKSIELLEHELLEKVQTGSLLMSAETKISDIFQLEKYFEFQEKWQEITTKCKIFFTLITINKFQKASAIIKELQEYFNNEMIPYLNKTLSKEDVDQSQFLILKIVQNQKYQTYLIRNLYDLFLLHFVIIIVQNSYKFYTNTHQQNLLLKN